MNIWSIPNLFHRNNKDRENLKPDLWGLDLLTPVFHCGNCRGNCFWGVPNPFTLHSAFTSRKHDLYLTHVLVSSPLLSEQSLWRCVFGVDTVFLEAVRIDLKDSFISSLGFYNAWSENFLSRMSLPVREEGVTSSKGGGCGGTLTIVVRT